jgi:hypothetical protein
MVICLHSDGCSVARSTFCQRSSWIVLILYHNFIAAKPPSITVNSPSLHIGLSLWAGALLHWHLHARLHPVLYGHSIRIGMLMTAISTQVHRHGWTSDALLDRDWTVLVCKHNRLEIYQLFSQLCDSLRQSIIFSAEKLDLGLEIGKPLLLALPAFEGSHTGIELAKCSISD